MKNIGEGQFALATDTNTGKVFLMRYVENNWEWVQDLTVEFANLMPLKVPNDCIWEFRASGKPYEVTCKEIK